MFGEKRHLRRNLLSLDSDFSNDVLFRIYKLLSTRNYSGFWICTHLLKFGLNIRQRDCQVDGLDRGVEYHRLSRLRVDGRIQEWDGRTLTVFWNSAMSKLANWATATELFREEYKVPLLPPEVAAYMAVSIELTAPVLLMPGLATRPVALVLLGMTAVIEIFVYPQAWPTHIQWAAMLLVLLCRGAGAWSLDHLLRQRWMR